MRTPVAIGLNILVCLASAASFASTRTLDLYNDALGLDPRPEHGAAVYRQRCASCHGPAALGKPEDVVPALAGQIESYLIKELVDFAELDRNVPEMHRLMAQPELDDPQMWRDLAAYLAQLRPNRKPQVGDGKDLEQGGRSYADYCAFCHGTRGEGSERGSTPALSSQHYAYLVLQLRSFDTDQRMNIEQPQQDHMAGLTRADVRGISDYLSRMQRVPPGSITTQRDPEISSPPAHRRVRDTRS